MEIWSLLRGDSLIVKVIMLYRPGSSDGRVLSSRFSYAIRLLDGFGFKNVTGTNETGLPMACVMEVTDSRSISAAVVCVTDRDIRRKLCSEEAFASCAALAKDANRP